MKMSIVIRKEEKPTVLLIKIEGPLVRVFQRCWQTCYQSEVISERSLRSIVPYLTAKGPVIVIVDVDLDWCKFDLFFLNELRRNTTCPILVLASITCEAEEVALLDAGADGCFAKPFSIHLLDAQVRAMLRRSMSILHPDVTPKKESHNSTLIFGNLKIHAAEQRVSLRNRNIRLTSGEFSLLMVLAENAGQPVNRDQLSEALLGRRWNGLDRTVDQRVKRLRSKIGDTADQPKYIRSVRGTGYMMIPSFD